MPPIRNSKKHTIVPSGPLAAAAEVVNSSNENDSKPAKKIRTEKVTIKKPKKQQAPAPAKVKVKAKANVKPINDYEWHPSVDYTSLNDQERQSRTILDLYTIFSVGGRHGLSVHNVRQMANELDMQELANSSPTTIRNAIERWSVLLQSGANNGRRCDHIGCKKPAAWGHWNEDPMACGQHKMDEMILLVPGRVVKMDDTPDSKYLMTDPLFSHVLPLNEPVLDTSNWWPELFELTSANELDDLLKSMSSSTPEQGTGEDGFAQEIEKVLFGV